MNAIRCLEGRIAVSVLLAAAVVVGTPGCRRKAAEPRGFETKVSDDVIFLLQEYPVAQSLARLDNVGRYSSVQELTGKGLLKEGFVAALEGRPEPKTVKGYVFADIEQDEDGKALDRRLRSGVCAYQLPVKDSFWASKEKKPVLLVLMDADELAEYNVYEARPEGPSEPVRRWPTGKELRTQFVRLERRIAEKPSDTISGIDEAAPTAPK